MFFYLKRKKNMAIIKTRANFIIIKDVIYKKFSNLCIKSLKIIVFIMIDVLNPSKRLLFVVTYH